jgi:DNA-binding NarL/FixJ family response regulator
MTLTTTTRVMVVDDHSLMVIGLRTLIDVEADLDVVATASSGEEAVLVAAATRPDVIVMDLLMPGKGGLAATRAILEALPATRVLVLTSTANRHAVVEAVRAGVVGYLLKDTPPDELVRAIRAAGAGQCSAVANGHRYRRRTLDVTAS